MKRDCIVNGERLEYITIYGLPAFFSNSRIKPEDVPDGMHRYDVRHDDSGNFCTIEPHVLVNHAGTILTKYTLLLPDEGLDASEAINFDSSWMNKPDSSEYPQVYDLRGNYIFTGKSMLDENGELLRQIMAIKDIHQLGRTIPKGSIGGYIGCEFNLDRDSNAWVAEGAKCYENSKVYGDAYIGCGTTVSGKAKVYGSAFVQGQCCLITGHAKVFGNSVLKENIVVRGRSQIGGSCELVGSIRVKSSTIGGNTRIHGVAMIDRSTLYTDTEDDAIDITTENFTIFDMYHSTIAGSAQIKGNVTITDSLISSGGTTITNDCSYSSIKLLKVVTSGPVTIKPDTEWCMFALDNAYIGADAYITKYEDVYVFQKDLSCPQKATAYRTKTGDINFGVMRCDGGGGSLIQGLTTPEFGYNYPDFADIIPYMMNRPDDDDA